MTKKWGQPEGGTQEPQQIDGGAATNDKLNRASVRDPAGDYVGAVTRTNEGMGEGSVAPASTPPAATQQASAVPQAPSSAQRTAAASKAGGRR